MFFFIKGEDTRENTEVSNPHLTITYSNDNEEDFSCSDRMN